MIQASSHILGPEMFYWNAAVAPMAWDSHRSCVTHAKSIQLCQRPWGTPKDSCLMMSMCRWFYCSIVWKWFSGNFLPPQLVLVCTQKAKVINFQLSLHGPWCPSLQPSLVVRLWYDEDIIQQSHTEAKSKNKGALFNSSYTLLSSLSFCWADGLDGHHQFCIQPRSSQQSCMQGVNLVSSLFFLWKKLKV